MKCPGTTHTPPSALRAIGAPEQCPSVFDVALLLIFLFLLLLVAVFVSWWCVSVVVMVVCSNGSALERNSREAPHVRPSLLTAPPVHRTPTNHTTRVGWVCFVLRVFLYFSVLGTQYYNSLCAFVRTLTDGTSCASHPTNHTKRDR